MNIHSYNELIDASRRQPEPQRLLFVLARAELPDEATDDQRTRFEARQGGYLEPVLCVDKLPEEVSEFSTFVAESQRTGVDWDLVFVASMSGMAGQAPQPEQAEQPLKMMVEQIKAGTVANFMTFDKAGDTVQLT